MVSEEIINEQYDTALKEFPKLNRPERVGELWEIKGSIDVIDDEGGYWETYDIKIFVPKKYPEELFFLLETGGKIKKNRDWHNLFGCCLSTEAVIYSVLGNDLSLLNWLKKFAHPFLANHVYKKETGDYANGEFLHETPGIIQGYEQLFGVKGYNEVYLKLKQLCNVLKLGRNDPCFCGSGKKFKNCFLKKPFAHRYLNIPYNVMEKNLHEIKDYLKIKRNV